jgi:hypothetical protein
MRIRRALDHGATPAELDALATLLAIYTGFARASRSLMIIRDELSKLDQANACAARRPQATSTPVAAPAASTARAIQAIAPVTASAPVPMALGKLAPRLPRARPPWPRLREWLKR